MSGPDVTNDLIDRSLDAALQASLYPPALAAAMRAAVFPGGGRLRPQLCLAVAASCGARAHPTAVGAAAAVELLHCASLVHDDMPCFDDAAWRRGRPALHRQFGEALAVLAGDGLIICAFSLLARLTLTSPASGASISAELSRAAMLLVAGQGWESEPAPDVKAYHYGKTAALFEAATVSGALAAGTDPAPWRPLGRFLGEAYQLADDLADIDEDSPALNVARLHGPGRTREKLEAVLHAAHRAVPAAVPASHALDSWFAHLRQQLGSHAQL